MPRGLADSLRVRECVCVCFALLLYLPNERTQYKPSCNPTDRTVSLSHILTCSFMYPGAWVDEVSLWIESISRSLSHPPSRSQVSRSLSFSLSRLFFCGREGVYSCRCGELFVDSILVSIRTMEDNTGGDNEMSVEMMMVVRTAASLTTTA